MEPVVLRVGTAVVSSAMKLGRISGVSEQLERVLNRLPAPTLMAPSGTESDAAFRSRYLRLVSESLDDIELFGHRQLASGRALVLVDGVDELTAAET
jgi:hypothetical protein